MVQGSEKRMKSGALSCKEIFKTIKRCARTEGLRNEKLIME
jgi:hypothetical protein